MIRHIVRFGFVVIWMGIIFYLSHQPASASSALSGGILEWVLRLVPFDVDEEFVHFLVRKGAHFSAYFMLGMLLMHAIRVKRLIVGMGVSLFIAVLYAASDEFHQTFIAGRSGEVRDVMIDSVGAIVGIIVYVVVMLYFAYKKAARS